MLFRSCYVAPNAGTRADLGPPDDLRAGVNIGGPVNLRLLAAVGTNHFGSRRRRDRSVRIWRVTAGPILLARISHHLTVEARERPTITSLRLLAVLTVPSEYASARQAARASY